MITGIMQPYFFPYLGYFQLIDSVDTFVFYDDVNYIKKGFIHRNKIKINGSPKFFGPTLIKPSQNKKINEVLINDGWQDSMLKTFQTFYSKALHFRAIYPLIERIITHPSIKTIADLNILGIREICKLLEIDRRFIISSEGFHSSVDLKKQHRLIQICKDLNSASYINSPGGDSLYTKKEFKESGINLKFISPINLEHYSILDLLMNNSVNNVKYLLKNYSLK